MRVGDPAQPNTHVPVDWSLPANVAALVCGQDSSQIDTNERTSKPPLLRRDFARNASLFRTIDLDSEAAEAACPSRRLRRGLIVTYAHLCWSAPCVRVS
jgi:hypothetical protein